MEGNLAKEYIANEFKNKSFSVSFLENYSICPYAFLLNNIFKVEELERQTQDYNPMDNGTIYHEVLRVYYEKYKDDFNNIGEFNTSNTYDFLKDSLLSQASKLGYSTSLSNEQLLIEDMYEKLKSFIEFDIDRLKKNEDIKPWSFEQWFNMDFKVDDNIIEVRGIIDRIDRTDDGKYLIMDYKSSSYGKKTIKDIENNHREASMKYQLKPYDGEIHLMKARIPTHYSIEGRYLGWDAYVKKVNILEMEGEHTTMFAPPHELEFAKTLQNLLF